MIFRRFAAVGILSTVVDVGVLCALRLGAGIPVIFADAISIVAAATVSYSLHRSVTFADDPHVRWVREGTTFAWVMLVAGAIDVGLCRSGVAVLGGGTAALLGAKAVALAGAGSVRWSAYRSVLFRRVREEQRKRPSRLAPPGAVRLSVVIPAYGEEERLGETIATVRRDLQPVAGDGGLEIVVVDDGSADATAEAARAAGADQVLVQPENRGKGAAVRVGVLAARGRTVAFTDADLSYPPVQLLHLLEQVEGGWDVVVGSRKHIETTELVRAGRLRALTGRVFNTLTLAVLLGQYRDTQCGLKAFRSDVGRLLFSMSRLDGFAFDVELFHLVERYHLSLLEVPVSLANSRTSTVRVGIDATRMVRDLFRVRRWAGRGVYDLDEEQRRVLTPHH
jgi:putative flippase GtrA